MKWLHDFDNQTSSLEEVSRKIFSAHFGQLAIIFLWTSGNLFHVAWQGNFEQWVLNPLKVKPIAHAIWDPHFGQPAIKAFSELIFIFSLPLIKLLLPVVSVF